jgi:hypothetical protein
MRLDCTAPDKSENRMLRAIKACLGERRRLHLPLSARPILNTCSRIVTPTPLTSQSAPFHPSLFHLLPFSAKTQYRDSYLLKPIA